MVDQELVLRWLAFRDSLSNYRPPLKRFLNDYMRRHQEAEAQWLQVRAEHFADTMQRIDDTLGPRAFRLFGEDGQWLRDGEGRPLPRGVIRALFDAQGTAFAWTDDPQLNDLSQEVVRAISHELAIDDLQDAVRRATGDRSRIRLRIARMVRALRASGVTVNVPEDVSCRNAFTGAQRSWRRRIRGSGHPSGGSYAPRRSATGPRGYAGFDSGGVGHALWPLRTVHTRVCRGGNWNHQPSFARSGFAADEVQAPTLPRAS